MVDFAKLASINKLRAQYQDCANCKLSECRSKVIHGGGYHNASLMVIGDAPREADELGGQFFAEDWLTRILVAVKIPNKDVWKTGTCLCRPRSTDEFSENRPLTMKEINACNPRLMTEIDIIEPSIIVLCGRTPMSMATGYNKLGDNRGWFSGKFGGHSHIAAHTYITYHPSCLNFGSKERQKIRANEIFQDWLEIARVYFEQKENSKKK